MLGDNFTELHGDKAFADDNAVVAGIGIIDKVKVAIIGQQKEEIPKIIFLEILE